MFRLPYPIPRRSSRQPHIINIEITEDLRDRDIEKYRGFDVKSGFDFTIFFTQLNFKVADHLTIVAGGLLQCSVQCSVVQFNAGLSRRLQANIIWWCPEPVAENLADKFPIKSYSLRKKSVLYCVVQSKFLFVQLFGH